MTENGEVLRELRTILKVLILSNSAVIEKELSRIATTNERKRMWVVINGRLMPKNIASQANVTQMAVSNFLNACKVAGFVDYTKGEPPKRVLDYVPPEWISLVKFTSTTSEENTADQSVASETDETSEKR